MMPEAYNFDLHIYLEEMERNITTSRFIWSNDVTSGPAHTQTAMEGKNELFQVLKRDCVALAQTAAQFKSVRVDQRHIIESLEKLKHTLLSATSTKENALDAKLAEYVFFPVAQLLRESQTLSIRCLEICLRCIATLVEHGWKRDIPPKLAAQLVILCSNLGEKSPKGLSFPETTDELQSWSFWCLYHVFTVSGANDEVRKSLTDDAALPQLGQTISVLLDGIQDGKSLEPQDAGTMALDALVVHVIEAEIQANFLPGLVSRLTKILTPQTKQRRNHKVLIGCLNIFEVLLKNTLNDEQPREPGSRVTGRLRHESIIDVQWKEAAACQLKPAISNILRLRSHARDDVKESVARLSVTLLRNCRQTLSNCSGLALEALITIGSEQNNSTLTYHIHSLMRGDKIVTSLLQTMLYDWLRKLPTIMQGSDEEAKAAIMARIRTAYSLLADAEADMATIDRTLAIALRDSAVVTLAQSNARQQPTVASSPIQTLDLKVLKHGTNGFHSGSQLAKYRGQETSLDSLNSIVKLAASYAHSSALATQLTRDLRHSVGDAQIANFWLLLSSTEAAIQRAHGLDELLELDDDPGFAHSEALEELYSFSLTTLTESSEEPKDTRLLSLALHTLALRARTAGQDFKYELVDALYPVLHTLATPDDQLQRDSISTLNVFTSACGYTSTKDLIVENVDYLTNAVALKLNAFDVSPQAPQVLLMMVRLAGPSLLPYLEDTVDSIFAALEDFHGYPLLVELLFKVLGAMAGEGVKAPQLAIANDDSEQQVIPNGARWQPTSMKGLIALLHREPDEEASGVVSRQPLEPHPKQPWKATQDTAQNDEAEDDEIDDHQEQQVDDTEPPPPAPKTYSLLFKITELTQHFLPSASPSLRTSLLSLIKTTVPAIARHENSFLPLINTLWPEVVARLDDEEPYAVASAIDVVGVLCEHAGDFMRTRIDYVWPRLVELRQSTAKKQSSAHFSKSENASGTKQHGGSLSLDLSRQRDTSGVSSSLAHHGDTSSRLMLDALVLTVTRIIRFVQISPEMFDEALIMLGPGLEQADVRQALHESNADALWLVDLKRGQLQRPERPSVPANCGWQFARIPG